MKTDQDRLISLTECADLLGLTAAAMYNLRHSGADLPPSFRVANKIKFRRSDVDVWLETKREQPRPAIGA